MTRKPTAPQGAQSYEELYQQLEETVRQLESGNLSLEQALAHYEAGMRLVTACEQLLDQAELRIQRVTTLDGTPGLEPWTE